VTHATPQAENHIHAPAEMAGRHPELSPWIENTIPSVDLCCFYYFLRNSLVALLEALFAREGHAQAGTVLKPVQGKEHRAQPLPETQGQQQKIVPSPLRERDKRQPHQPRTQQPSSIDSNSQPMRTAHLAP